MRAAHKHSEKPVRKEMPKRAGSFSIRKTMVIGLTGGIATGKTAVAQMFEEKGAKVISADEIAHELLKSGTAVREEVIKEFGKTIQKKDGSIERQRLAEIVFCNPQKKTRLESFIHPPVIKKLKEEIKRFRSEGEGVLILEVPLLIESSSLRLVEKVLVVAAEQGTQIKRLEKRYGLERDEAMLRIKSQLPVSEKIKYANWVINTEGTLSDTKRQVDKVWNSIQKLLALQR